MTSLTEILGVLYNRGLVTWRADFAADECHEMISLISDTGAEVVVDLWIDSERQSLFVERFLTDAIDLTQKTKMVNLFYVSLATANMELCERGHIGTCHMYTDGEFSFIYSSAIPLFCNAEMIATLVMKSLSAISLVKPFFRSIEKKADADILTVGDVFSFHQECVVGVHPFLKVPPEAKSALGTWMGTSGFTSQSLAGLFQSSSALQIFYVLTDISISIFASDGKGNVKIGESGVPTNLDDKTSFILFAEECWNIYIALAAMLNVPLSNDYLNCNDFLMEIDSSLFW